MFVILPAAKKLSDSRGVSLIELMIAVAITLIIASSAVFAYRSVERQDLDNTTAQLAGTIRVMQNLSATKSNSAGAFVNLTVSLKNYKIVADNNTQNLLKLNNKNESDFVFNDFATKGNVTLAAAPSATLSYDPKTYVNNQYYCITVSNTKINEQRYIHVAARTGRIRISSSNQKFSGQDY